jgi:hypothetical protein
MNEPRRSPSVKNILEGRPMFDNFFKSQWITAQFPEPPLSASPRRDDPKQ